MLALPRRGRVRPTSSTSSGWPSRLRPLSAPATAGVLTAHDVMPREPRPGQSRAQRRLYDALDAVVVHSELRPRAADRRAWGSPGEGPRDPPRRVRAPHRPPDERRAARRAGDAVEAPVVLFFGLLRPYKGLDALLEALAARRTAPSCGSSAARACRSIARRAAARRGARRAAGSRALSPTRRCPRSSAAPTIVVLPYSRDRAVGRAGHRAGFRQAAGPERRRRLRRGGRGTARRGWCRPTTPRRCAARCEPAGRRRGARAPRQRGRRAAAGPYSWDAAAARRWRLYRDLVERP